MEVWWNYPLQTATLMREKPSEPSGSKLPSSRTGVSEAFRQDLGFVFVELEANV